MHVLADAIANNIWILIPLTALCIPIVAILLAPYEKRVKTAERREARQTYERLAMEKLDILRTAVAMGYKTSELQELDTRLEKLIGGDKLKAILTGDKTLNTADLQIASAGLDQELGAVRTKQEATG